MSDKIIQLPGTAPLPENLLTVRDDPKHRFNYCKHGRIVLDHHNRLVNCAECEATLDPFNFLEQQAGLLQRAWSNYSAAQRKVEELTTSVSNLLAEEKRLKARIRTAKEKQPVIDTRGKDKL